MKYTLSQAATATGKAKSTIFKACRDGLVSSTKDERGRFMIDPAELHRVFPAVSAERSTATAPEQTRMDEETLKAVIERDFLKREVDQLRSVLEEMRSDRDEWRRQAQTLALTDGRQGKGEQPTSLLSRLFGPRKVA